MQQDLKMESNGNANAAAAVAEFRRRHLGKRLPSVRLFSVPPNSSSSSSTNPTDSQENEFTEQDIFSSSSDFSSSESSSALHTPTSAAASFQPQPHFINQPGILAALPFQPESDARSVFNHKASPVSASPESGTSPVSLSSCARMIIRNRPPQRHKLFQQSAPVNIPILSEAMRRSREARLFDDVVDDSDDEDDQYRAGSMPPHLIVGSKTEPMITFSVLEGVGRTLKGRDLTRVRNAVFERTGFED